MVKFMKGALLAGVASFALASVASAQLTDAEFKCQASVSKAGSKFVGSKAKCASKCIAGARKVPAVNPVGDCYAPYAGTTANCIVTDPLKPGKSAEEKFNAAILKACDDTLLFPKIDCPECYSGGDCVSEAGDRVQNVEANVDNFGPGVFCEQPGADKLENSCEANTAKTLVKLVGSLNKCTDKCHSNERKGLIAAGQCSPAIAPPDPATLTCINTARSKAVTGVNKKCRTIGETVPGANDGTTAVPDCFGPNDYPDGSTWVTLVDGATEGQVAGTYCASPSGAFLN